MREQELSGQRRTADVVVVGGGVIGLAVARALALRGVGRVMLCESGRLGAEASSAAGGMLAVQAEADEADAFLELATKSREMYSSFAVALREETGIDIELEETGTLYLAFNERDEAEIEHRYGWQSRAGLRVEKLTAEEARRIEPSLSPEVRGALRFPLDVQVENRRLLAALVAAAEKYGVDLWTNTRVASVSIERGRVAGVETSRGFISTPLVVLACGAWLSLINSEGGALPHISIEPVRGQMLCFEARQSVTRHVIYSPRGYLVPRLDGRLLAGSTTEHAGFDKSVTGAGVHTIMEHALEIAPAVGGLALADMWAGLRPRATDELPVIGPCSETRGLFYAAGHYRNGILLAPVTGELIADALMQTSPPPLLDAFTPDRFMSASTV
ncbi:MAG TPA: glycine oxidase ThiO [Pyrinomonadaceae bacterium]